MDIKYGDINIRPTVGVYATYQRLSYKPWFAVAEFVDNSTQSYFKNREELINQYIKEGGKKLQIHINYDSVEKTLEILDNAYGMEIEDFTRALVLDSPPSDKSGRSEFGMGLKTAACWFGKKWTVKTTRLGSDRCLIATIDVDELAKTHHDNLQYKILGADPDEHYTIIRIEDIQQPIRGRTATRIKEQLSSIYREDIRTGEIEIFWNGEPLEFEDPPFLEEQKEDGTVEIWKKEVFFLVPWERKGCELPVKGWVGIRNPGKARDAGFVLLRRGRVIIGGPEQGYKPHEIFGNPNQAPSQRLIGELHMDDWPVTQAKDGFDWNDGLEDAFIDALANEPTIQSMLQKSIDYRASDFRKFTRAEFEQVTKNTQKIFEGKHFTDHLNMEIKNFEINNVDLNEKHSKRLEAEGVLNAEPSFDFEIPERQEIYDLLRQASEGPFVYQLHLDGREWIFKLYWQDVRTSNWMSLRFQNEDEIEIFLNINHPFFTGYINNPIELELLQKIIMAMALAEKLARLSTSRKDGFIDPADFRLFMNKILRWAGDFKEVRNDG